MKTFCNHGEKFCFQKKKKNLVALIYDLEYVTLIVLFLKSEKE